MFGAFPFGGSGVAELDPVRLAQRLQDLRDPRVERTRRHLFADLVLMTICGILCGADSYVEIERFARLHQEWFESFLSLPAGVPSHDTIARLFARLDPETLSRTLNAWARQCLSDTDAQAEDAQNSESKDTPDGEVTLRGKVINVDGKALRDSFCRAAGLPALHLVSAFCPRYNLVLAQRKVDEKSNEQTAIAPLLDQIDIEGATITADALNTQKHIAGYIVARKADYVLALKQNHPRLLNDVEGFFERGEARGCFWNENADKLPHGEITTRNNDHGRLEIRRYLCAPAPEWLDGYEEWAGLKTLIRVERTRRTQEKTNTEVAYYLSSLDLNVRRLAKAVRSHWGIENQLHWVLDIAFDEDHCRTRTGHAHENLASVRRFCLTLLKNDKTAKVGVKTKRKMAGWDNSYRSTLITRLCN